VSNIRHVVFDLGQVLVRWDPEAPYRRLIPDAAERRRFLAEICNHAWNLEQDRGRTWGEAEALLIAEHPDKAHLIRAYRANWHEMIPGPIEDNVAIAEALMAKGVDVTALTNWAADTFDEISERVPIFGKFRGVTVSGKVRLVKPDPAIYRHHAATHGVEPAAALFFDDSPRNVEGARAVGWNAELYVSTGKLRDDLRRHGLME
jgi:HAD superfamily hydrolase (TIGR01509 family)